jgi:hypothetical protein
LRERDAWKKQGDQGELVHRCLHAAPAPYATAMTLATPAIPARHGDVRDATVLQPRSSPARSGSDSPARSSTPRPATTSTTARRRSCGTSRSRTCRDRRAERYVGRHHIEPPAEYASVYRGVIASRRR